MIDRRTAGAALLVYGVATVAKERASTTRSSARRRKPNVVECAKKARSTAASDVGGESAESWMAGRPFFIRIGADQTSTAPAAKSAS